MKKYILLLIILFLPIMVNALQCDTDKISISSIDKIISTGDTKELSPAEASGKDLNINISMGSVNDSIRYKVTVKNESEEDYDFDKTSINISSDYITYSFKSDDNSNIIKANTTKEFYLNVTYTKEVPEDEFTDGIFNDNQAISVDLSNDNDLINPSTGISISMMIIIVIIILCGILFTVFNNKKYSKYMILLIGLLFIPVSVYSLCLCRINVNSKVRIENNIQQFCYKTKGSYESNEYRTYYFRYEKGMTWAEFINSDYNTDGSAKAFDYLVRDPEFISSVPTNVCHNNVYDENGDIKGTDVIYSRHDGCYLEVFAVC